MAIDSRIPLAGNVQPVNLQPGLNALLQVNQDQRQAQMAPLQNKLLQNQVAGQEMQMDEKRRAQMRDMGEFAFESYKALRELPPEQRAQAYQTLHSLSKEMFGDMVKDDLQPLDDAALDAGIKQFSMFDPMRDKNTLTPYQAATLSLQKMNMDQQSQDRAENRSFRQQQLGAQTANQQQLNEIRQQQADTAAAAQQATRESAAQKAEVKATGLDQELINLEGVMADINRAEELLKTNKNITGPLVGMTPSVTEAAQELESLSQALGIGALQQFKGATSEKELAAALRSGLSMKSDAAPNLKRLAAQRAVVQRNIDRIKKLRGGASSQQQPPAQGGQLSPADQQAVDWAKANPNDPRAAQILQLHGAQ